MAAARSMATRTITGTPGQVVAGLEALAGATGADELMLFTPTYALDERLDSLDAIADAWAR